MSMSTKKMKETFFITHGAPMVAVDESFPVRHFLSSWKEKVLPNIIPKPILLISAQWDTSVPTVNVIFNGNVNDTIYDFDNIPLPLPNSLYQLKYPAPGASELAKRVKELLTESGFNRVDEDKTRGLDHAAWVPLMLMYPEANIPVCQLSVQSSKDATHHYNMGRALAPLKEEGVLIIGSGAATHNFSDCSFQDDSVASWAMEFDTWLKHALLQGRYEDVNRYEEKAPHAKRAHPQPDHFYPLHVAMGAAGADAKANLIYQSWGSSAFSYASYQFTTATPPQLMIKSHCETEATLLL